MVVFIFIQILIKHSVETRSVASDLGLHSLHMSRKKDARLKWV